MKYPESLDKPSELASGTVENLLIECETKHPDIIYDGTVPRNWVAAATYVDSFILKKNLNLSNVGTIYSCGTDTMSRNYQRLLRLEATDEIYSESLPHKTSIGALMHQRRFSIPMLTRTTRENEKSVRKRIRASKRNDPQFDIIEVERAGRTFYTAEPSEEPKESRPSGD